MWFDFVLLNPCRKSYHVSAEAAASAPQLSAHPQRAPVEQFLETYNVSESVNLSGANQVGTHDSGSGHNSPNVDARLELIHTFVPSTKVYLCTDVTVVDVKHTLKRKACSVCLQALLYKTFARRVLMSTFETLQP